MTDSVTLPITHDPDDAPRIGDVYDGRIIVDRVVQRRRDHGDAVVRGGNMSIEEKVFCPVCKTERGITKRRTIERHKMTFMRWGWRGVERQCKGTAQPATDEMVREWVARKIETIRAAVTRNEEERAKADDEVVKAQRRSMQLRDMGEQLRSALAETEAFAAAKATL